MARIKMVALLPVSEEGQRVEIGGSFMCVEDRAHLFISQGLAMIAAPESEIEQDEVPEISTPSGEPLEEIVAEDIDSPEYKAREAARAELMKGWVVKMEPAKYLAQYPKGPHADKARAIVNFK